MNFPQKFWRQSWFLIVPLSIVGIFLIYILLPGVILRNQNNEVVLALRAEKESLTNSLQDLTAQSEAAVCVGEELIIPSGGTDDVMPPQNASDLVGKLEESVVLVITEKGIGSGFFVTPTKIITNGHVVQDAAAAGSNIWILNASIGRQKARISDVQYSGDFDSEDFALLTIDNQIGKPLTLVKVGDPRTYKLEKVFAAGFPGIVIETDESSVPDLVITDGTISSTQKIGGKVSAFVHTAQISPGNSGGPLVNQCGNVVGINTFYVSGDSERYFSLTSSELLQFLSQNGLAPRVAAGGCE
jgi:S1-C subfamily serine protease